MSAPTIAPRITVNISEIKLGERIRQDFGNLDELIQSFKDNEEIGKPRLIHPIVVDRDMTLIDGGRRLEAHQQAGYTTIDIAFYECMDEGVRLRLEVDANKHKRFNWMEQCLAVERYHRYYSTRAALQSESWGLRETGAMLGMAKSPVHYNVMVAPLIRANDQEIIKCESLRDAIQVLIDRKEKEANRRLVELTMKNQPTAEALLNTNLGKSAAPKVNIPSITDDDDFYSQAPAVNGQYTPGIVGPDGADDEVPGAPTPAVARVIPLTSMLFKTDCINWMAANPGSVDHIITDIPYGIDMGNLQQSGTGMDISSVKAEHDVEDNIELFTQFFPAAFKSLKSDGFLITWMDFMHWNRFYELATAAGFKVQRWPLIWHKTHSCLNQAAKVNFTKNSEIAIVCRKGNASLLKPQTTSVWTGSNDIEARLLGHPFVKPAALWTWLYESVATRGSTVLDPFAGVGSSTIPAIRYGLRPITCEINEDHYNRQVGNVQNLYLSLDKTVKFA